MEIKFNVTGNDRKALVKAIADISGQTSKYLGAPNFAYQIGDCYIVSKNGDLSVLDEADKANVNALVEELYRRGFESEAAAESVDNEGVIEVQFPRTGFSETTVDNLKKLIASKGSLIKESLGINTLEVKEYDDRIGFPWFETGMHNENMKEYHVFLEALIKMAKEQKRVTAKETEVTNKKYAFRCFLLRLGFIGAEYKTARKTLLRNFEGSSAFKDGKKKEATSDTSEALADERLILELNGIDDDAELAEAIEDARLIHELNAM